MRTWRVWGDLKEKQYNMVYIVLSKSKERRFQVVCGDIMKDIRMCCLENDDNGGAVKDKEVKDGDEQELRKQKQKEKFIDGVDPSDVEDFSISLANGE
ncbi:uncharacterized protein G2W53_015517 [Senna tora]|uniref:Uncharacterized protein n=1 Tax=Senna tora TaxID=362788 RepID=A0A834WVG0_9FABA|nr:uncharacterized protein G2W53_015517 [Senna tora]